MPLEGLHRDRDRAGSFGGFAQDYDRYRPGYPERLLDHLVSLRPAVTLDVGCGTGKVAAPLARRGLRVVGVEPDLRMAAVAPGHGVQVDVATFETWAGGDRQFDLLTCGQAWHWIDPEAGLGKAAAVLRAGATIELFWNYHLLDEHLLAAFDEVYRAYAPHLEGLGHDPSGRVDADPFAGSKAFTPGRTHTYWWDRHLTADEWVALVATYSDHRGLGSGTLRRLQQALHATIQRSGGLVHARGGTYVWSAQRTNRRP